MDAATEPGLLADVLVEEISACDEDQEDDDYADEGTAAFVFGFPQSGSHISGKYTPRNPVLAKCAIERRKLDRSFWRAYSISMEKQSFFEQVKEKLTPQALKSLVFALAGFASVEAHAQGLPQSIDGINKNVVASGNSISKLRPDTDSIVSGDRKLVYKIALTPDSGRVVYIEESKKDGSAMEFTDGYDNEMPAGQPLSTQRHFESAKGFPYVHLHKDDNHISMGFSQGNIREKAGHLSLNDLENFRLSVADDRKNLSEETGKEDADVTRENSGVQHVEFSKEEAAKFIEWYTKEYGANLDMILQHQKGKK